MKKEIVGALGALLISTLACSIFLGGPAYPTEPVSAPTPDGLTLDQELAQALVGAATTGEVTVHVTQSQLTDYLRQQLASQPNPAIEDPRVYLEAGHMLVYGRATRGTFTANVSVALHTTIDPSGQPKIEVESIFLGPVPAPKALNDAVASTIQEAVTGWFGPVASGFRLESIDIADGVMTVTGRIK